MTTTTATTKSNSKTVNKDTVRRKTGVAELELKSEAVFLFMRSRSGKTLNNAMYRIAELFKMANNANNIDVFNQLKDWYSNEVIGKAQEEINNLVEHYEKLQEGNISSINFIDIKNPSMKVKFDVIHKSHMAVIDLISKIDFIMDDIEAMELSSSWSDDSIEKSSRTQALYILTQISMKVFKTTKPGKRDGGAFNAAYFIDGLKSGVFTLYPDEAIKDEPGVSEVSQLDDADDTSAEDEVINTQTDIQPLKEVANNKGAKTSNATKATKQSEQEELSEAV
ncbi:hypothetical protein TUM3794_20680 [Shewanella colwelliana]|uniref:DUF1845 domain-containing protein n=1 Tax=Shewanella colwelliana TaxID=23 RepID=A0ABQ4P0U5_SHECO|nr:hypothetical protein [Shewanella colwelliana]GIU41076.1 hypothetical protein TUM3794_20680 [Shewanella colwelliana]